MSAGQLGAEPLPDSKFLTLINAQGRLKTEKEFGDIVLKSGTDGEIVRLSDVARLNWARAIHPALAAGRQERGGYRHLPVAGCQRAGNPRPGHPTMDEMQKTMPADVEVRSGV